MATPRHRFSVPRPSNRPPPGFRLTATQAIRIASQTDVFGDESPHDAGRLKYRVPRARGRRVADRPLRGLRAGRRGHRRRRRRQRPRRLARPAAGHAARPRLRRRRRAEGQRALRMAPAERALHRAVPRSAPPAADRPPRPAGAARPRRLALLLQPRRHHGLGRAHLSRARLLPRPHARRGPVAARARRPAGAGGPDPLAPLRRGRAGGRAGDSQCRRLPRHRHRRCGRDRRRPHRPRTGPLQRHVLAGNRPSRRRLRPVQLPGLPALRAALALARDLGLGPRGARGVDRLRPR